MLTADQSPQTTDSSRITGQRSNTFESPKHKQMKGHATNTPSCRTQLSFQGENDLGACSTSALESQLESCSISHESSTTEQESETANIQVAVLSLQNSDLNKQLIEVQEAFDEYVLLTDGIMTKQESIISLYKEITDSGQMLGGLLSISEKNAIKSEINVAKEVFNLGLRGNDAKDLMTILNPSLFENMLQQLKHNCPTIVCVLEQLVLSANATRNTIKTPEMKMKAAVHLLASLIDVRDQNAQNDIPVLFGLLCLSFGAGPSVVGLLQRLGLSESYPVLIKVLKFQLQHYKELIEQRAANDCPVVTFQDNMQLMRTSLRHLRLSKLHKEKVKQNKMWDFTVRGWRVADISGIEDLFTSEAAIKPQQSVKSLKCEDLLLENNPIHKGKWEDFKVRNTLRKMDVAFNVPITTEQLKTMNSEELQSQATRFTEVPSQSLKPFKIKIPEIPCEFPDMAKKEAKIYPLPISHENQCTTLGVASNLDLFQEEFGFHSVKTKNYLPLKCSGDEFDLDQAYKRFEFLKKLEQHKNQQKDYEQILRGHASAGTVQTEPNIDDDQAIFTVVDCEIESDSYQSD